MLCVLGPWVEVGVVVVDVPCGCECVVWFIVHGAEHGRKYLYVVLWIFGHDLQPFEAPDACLKLRGA